MESNWRYLVWETGWHSSRVTLVARVLNPLLSYTHVAQIPGFGFNNVWAGTATVQGYVPIWTLLQVRIGRGWPFTVEVYPD